MKLLNKLVSFLLWIIICPFNKATAYRIKRLKSKILKDVTLVDNCRDYYKLKNLSWELYDDADFVLANKTAKRLAYITQKKGDFPGSNGLLANANTVLGLVVVNENVKLANSYLLKTAKHPIFNDKKDQKLFLLAQKLLDIGEEYTVQLFLKKKIDYMKNLEIPNVLKNHVDGVIRKMENSIKEINQGKESTLIKLS